VTRFHDPPSCTPLGNGRLIDDLLTTRADVTNQPVLDQQRADFGVVICPVEAQAMGPLRGRGGTVDRDRLDRCFQELVIVAVRAGVIDPERDPSGVGEDGALRPLLARSVGFGPVFGPPNGALVIAPSAARNDQSTPTCSSYSSSP